MSIRWRLAIVYAAVAVASAAVLLAGIYVLVSLQEGNRVVVGSTLAPGTVPPPSGGNEVFFRKALIDAREEAVDSTLYNLLVWSGVGLLLMAAVSVVVGWGFAGRALAPVHTITSRARRISADSLDERLRLDGPRDELREMAETFDELLDRIQDTVELERRLVATMSHELRTPIANQRAALDVALSDPDADPADLRRAGEVALGQAMRAQRTVDALLTLARVQSGAETARLAPVDLTSLVEMTIEAVRADHPEAATLGWEADIEPVSVFGDEELLARAIGNLLVNAVVHNRRDGWVRVRLTTDVGIAVLEVSNSGPALDPEAVASLILPFRRGTADRTSSHRGAGLGLTIVQAVADHHSGTLDLVPGSEADGGLMATLSLPLA